MLWRCFICCVFIYFSLKLLLSHINRQHSRSPDFRLLCGIDGCTEEYRVYNSFYHHVKRRHSQHLLEGTRPGDGTQEGEHPLEESQVLPQQDNIQPDQLLANSSITDHQLHDSDEGQMGIDQGGAVTVQQDLTTHATAFVINARAKHRLSQMPISGHLYRPIRLHLGSRRPASQSAEWAVIKGRRPEEFRGVFCFNVQCDTARGASLRDVCTLPLNED
ncbi:uncharacterized protein LOC117751592 [Cyclopterus lumpus]|uniref:uncharacterized protein LOC117751592 n=1 Tax=Cyclopterus lumpus TaxID=8103 RepID=UPI0014875B8F|nr:uncharacterized protein LOC117751592 [Cyclopterus lumpus]